jgi:hypothetical protein
MIGVQTKVTKRKEEKKHTEILRELKDQRHSPPNSVSQVITASAHPLILTPNYSAFGWRGVRGRRQLDQTGYRRGKGYPGGLRCQIYD